MFTSNTSLYLLDPANAAMDSTSLPSISVGRAARSSADSADTLPYPSASALTNTGQFSRQGSSSRSNTSDSTAVAV